MSLQLCIWARPVLNSLLAPQRPTYMLLSVHLPPHPPWLQVWDKAFWDAAQVCMPPQLRSMFAVMLLFDPPAGNAQALWDSFRDELCEDFLIAARTAAHNPQLQLTAAIEDEGLRHLQRIVRDGGKTLAACGMREPAAAAAAGGGVGGRLIWEHSGGGNQAALQQQVQQQEPKLNRGQRAVYDQVMGAVGQGLGGLQGHAGQRASNAFFVDSPGGCGKTFLFNLLLDAVRSRGQVALAVASSGIAALLLHQGRTAHSMLKIPIPIQPDSHCRVAADSEQAALLRAATLVVWDEAPMMHQHCFLAVGAHVVAMASLPLHTTTASQQQLLTFPSTSLRLRRWTGCCESCTRGSQPGRVCLSLARWWSWGGTSGRCYLWSPALGAQGSWQPACPCPPFGPPSRA